MTPNQEKAFDTVVNDFEGEVYREEFHNAVFLAGYALGAQERQAQDARICRSFVLRIEAEGIATIIESTPTEPVWT